MDFSKFVFSYSSVSCYETCPLAFKLSYIDKVERDDNYFSQHGTLVHMAMEKFFSGELDMFTLSDWYEENYDRIVLCTPPAFQPGLEKKNKDAAREFFDTFSVNRDDYSVLFLEKKITGRIGGAMCVVKPDVVLIEKATGKTIIIDVKTSHPYKPNGKLDGKKVLPYARQLSLYSHMIEKMTETKIDVKQIWFIKSGFVDVTGIVSDNEAAEWFAVNVLKIWDEKTWSATPPSSFFCGTLCSVRLSCEYGRR